MAVVQTWGTSFLTSWLTSWHAEPSISEALAARDSRLYTNFIDNYGGSILPTSDTIKVIPVDIDYVFDADHVYLSEVGVNALLPAATLTGTRWLTGDQLKYSIRKLIFLSVTGSVGSFILYKDTGNSATSELISYHREDFNNLTKEMTGGDLEWILNTGGFFDVIPEDVFVGRVVSFTHRIGASLLTNLRS